MRPFRLPRARKRLPRSHGNGANWSPFKNITGQAQWGMGLVWFCLRCGDLLSLVDYSMAMDPG
jgi:hypothetical protein